MGEKKAFTCENPSCRKSFTNPLKTLNLQQNPKEPYYTCPYCLSKIEISDERVTGEKLGEDTTFEKTKQKLNQVETKAKLTKNTEKPAACHFHPGYLSERSSKEKLPDECLACKDIVDCMLKKMHE